jgi:hypothetical protein
MKRQEVVHPKADQLLQAALQRTGKTSLRAILFLRSLDGKISAEENPPDPGKFSSRTAYREALIDHRQRSLARSQGDTIQQLVELGLDPRGGKTLRAVVVEGEPEKLRQALELPGVARGVLDRQMTLDKPRRPAVRK